MSTSAQQQDVTSSSVVEIVECKTKAQRRQFIDFQWVVYKGDPYWVPPLISERESFYDSAKNPFFEHSDVTMFMAMRNGQVVGTISAIQNNRHNEAHHEKIGFFGSFEVINDYDVARALLDAARDWAKARGLTALRGPATFSSNEEFGLLVEGFDMEPKVLMPYNPRYYMEFLERYGFKKAMDLLAWWGPTENAADAIIGKRFERIAEMAMKRGKFTVRNPDLRKFDEEVALIKKVYDQAWVSNWGFVPPTDKEIDHLGEGLRQFIDTDFVFIAQREDGEPIGVSVGLPNVNHPLRMAYPNPKTPELWTLLKFLWYRRTNVDSIRIWALGVVPQYRMSGVDTVMIYKTLQAVVRRKMAGGELSWILETNDAMNRIIQLANPVLYKKYRLYDFAL